MLLANMTLHAPDGLEIVLMERFESLTKKVDCNGDDGILSLTFKSKDAFDQALTKWSFINEGDDKNFLLIANHAGCGPDDERQPYQLVFRRCMALYLNERLIDLPAFLRSAKTSKPLPRF